MALQREQWWLKQENQDQRTCDHHVRTVAADPDFGLSPGTDLLVQPNPVLGTGWSCTLLLP